MKRLSPQNHIEIVSPGTRMTVQDLGRWGSQRYGVSVSGVLDLQAAVLANRLVGNPTTSALLEATFGNVVIRFTRETRVAITGATVDVSLDHFPIPTWETVIAPAESELIVSAPSVGLYSYIGIEGGIEVPEVLGSRSTHVASGIGGLNGRSLEQGDVIPLGSEPTENSLPLAGSRIPESILPACEESARRIRAIPGPQFELFDEDAVQTFLNAKFSVSNLTDRQGARLAGPEVNAVGGKHDIVSDPAYMGAVQVPADGMPIILLADRQPTGGYAKIASVVSADLPAVVQKAPGGEIQFEMIDVASAQTIARNFRRELYEFSLSEPEYVNACELTVDDETYNVELVHPSNVDRELYENGIAYATIDSESEVVVTYQRV